MTEGCARVRDMDNESIKYLMGQIQKAEAQIKQQQELVKQLRSRLVDVIKETGHKSFSYEDEDFEYRATVVHTKPVEVDYDKMLADKVFTPEEVDLITTRKFSNKLLEEAIEKGLVSGVKVSGYLSYGKERESVRIVSQARSDEAAAEEEGI